MAQRFVILPALISAFMASAPVARADVAAPPGLDGNPIVLVVIGVVVIAVLWLLIRGALSMSGNDEDDDGSAGFGPLEGIDEDDDDRKKKKRK